MHNSEQIQRKAAILRKYHAQVCYAVPWPQDFTHPTPTLPRDAAGTVVNSDVNVVNRAKSSETFLELLVIAAGHPL